jgi:hypothetical protein
LTDIDELRKKEASDISWHREFHGSQTVYKIGLLVSLFASDDPRGRKINAVLK